MCGRFAITAPKEAVEELFGIDRIAPFPPRYNIAPTQPILLVAAGDKGRQGANHPERRAVLARWGLWPSWVKNPRDFPLLFNARAESAMDKPAFRSALRYRRVLVPASGFYEWKRPPKGSRAKPQAYWVRPKSGGIVAFAGLLEIWASADGSEVDTAAIITTAATGAFAAIHHRMPLVVHPENYSRWLDCALGDAEAVGDLLAPVDSAFLEAVPVSDRVNKVAHADAAVQQPVELAEEDTAAGAVPDDCVQPSLF